MTNFESGLKREEKKYWQEENSLYNYRTKLNGSEGINGNKLIILKRFNRSLKKWIKIICVGACGDYWLLKNNRHKSQTKKK